MQIQNSSTIRELRTAAGLSISEGFPQGLANQIVPVIELNPKLFRLTNVLRDAASVSTGSTTIFTTSSDKDFFLTNVSLTTEANATADSVFTKMEVIQDGVTRVIALIRKLSLTAHSSSLVLQFNNPLKVDRGTAITITQSFTVGASTTGGLIAGFEVEPFESL